MPKYSLSLPLRGLLLSAALNGCAQAADIALESAALGPGAHAAASVAPPQSVTSGSPSARVAPPQSTSSGSPSASIAPPQSTSNGSPSASIAQPQSTSSGSPAARITPPQSTTGGSAAASIAPPQSTSSGSPSARIAPPQLTTTDGPAASIAPPQSTTNGGPVARAAPPQSTSSGSPAARVAPPQLTTSDGPAASIAPQQSTTNGSLAARRQSVLFKVSKDGQVGYLFGTIHVGAKSFYPLAPEVSRALSEANELVLELDTRANDAFQRAVAAHASYPAGDSIDNHVSADTLARLTQALHAVGIPLSSVAHLKPWLLANILMGMELQRSGFDRSHGNEFFLLEQAQARGTAVTELESADLQLALFDTLSHADAERYLRESLTELSDGSSLRKAKAIIDAWRSGDTAALEALIPDAIEGDTVMAEFTRRMVLGKRNPEMAERIERIMQAGKAAFVGVGLLHLLGADGLPRLLARRGFAVEKVY